MAASLAGIFLQESFGSFLLLVLLFPFGAFLGDTWPSWITHFFLVMLHDWITGGAQVNPAVSVATTFYGWNTASTAVTRIIAQLIGGSIAFPIIERVLPAYVKMGGPELGTTSVQDGFLWEFSLTATLLFLVYGAATQAGLPAQRPLIAGGIRGLIYYGGKTGPAMNPMIAFAWALYAAPRSINADHFVVYWVASTLGAIAGTAAWVTVEKLFLSRPQEVDKED